MKTKDRRERGLNDLARVIEKLWGRRCSQHDAHCPVCNAWMIFDMMERLTDSQVIE